jgi:hypothetical protein
MSAILQMLLAAGGGPAFSTWDIANRNGLSLSGGNLVANASGGSQGVIGTKSHSSLKWYFEVTVNAGTLPTIGIATAAWGLRDHPGLTDTGGSYYASGPGLVYNGGTIITAGIGAIVASEVIGIGVDISGDKFYAANSNAWEHGANPSTGSLGLTISGGPFFPAFQADGACIVTLNTGATPFTYTPPTGFSPWG